MTRSVLILLVLLTNLIGLRAETSFRITEKEFPTYPYYDANPIPVISRFYPYFRFDGFSIDKRMKKWKVIELSNEYLSMDILPEIGGKIWSVTENSTGKSIVYSNPVIKFRDVGMRGPWTSGGIEVNVGLIGHTPNCSSPVDYDVRKNDDGSVSCFIGALDLIARANWEVEINLPEKSAVFSMRFYWHNGSGQSQPYYTWTNVGVRADGGMKAVDPGTNYIGHGGEIESWPYRKKDARDLSVYKNNDFGSYKSYHILGNLAEYFGVYYHDEDFGVASVIPSEGKRGRKIWIWGLSREGMIWENLLTDPPGKQYVEIQSGRLFNQCRGASSFTPFKNREFAPYSTDRWLEYWLPVMKIGGYKTASVFGGMNVSLKGTALEVGICPVRMFKADLEVYDGQQLIWKSDRPIDFETLKPFYLKKTFKKSPKDLRVIVGDGLLAWPGDSDKDLSRFWISKLDQKKIESPSADYNYAREMLRDRQFGEADKYYKKCLKKDPLYCGAYTGLAENANRRGDYDLAADYARQALAVDIYDGPANYQFGLAAMMTDRLTDAKEAFSLSVLPDVCRSAGFTGLAKVRLKAGEYRRAAEAAEQALEYNTGNADAVLIRCAALRKSGSESDKKKMIRDADRFLDAHPLLTQIRAELFLAGAMTADQLCGHVQCELPHESFIEIAAWYKSAGCFDDACRIIETALTKKEIRRTELLYYLAFLKKDPVLLKSAEKEPSDFCFPFRVESLDVFHWAVKNGSSWKNKYYLAALLAFLEKKDQAVRLLAECGNKPDYAPFYAFRADLLKSMNDAAGSQNGSGNDSAVKAESGIAVENDYKKAFELEPDTPRYVTRYAKYLSEKGKKKELLALTGVYIKKYPTDTGLVLLRAGALLANRLDREAFEFLEKAVFLPAEGSLLARNIYYRAAVNLAADSFETGRFAEALDWCEKARKWPENLGSGKPYPEFCDERLEDWISFLCLKNLGQQEKADPYLKKIVQPVSAEQKNRFDKNPKMTILTALALRALGQVKESEKLIESQRKQLSDNLLSYYEKNKNVYRSDSVISASPSNKLPIPEDDQERLRKKLSVGSIKYLVQEVCP